jgi:hypothetical protein
MVAKRRSAVHRNTVGGQRAAPGRGGPGGADAGRASSPCPRPRPASGVQCPVRASSVHACLSTRPLSSVRCGRLSVQLSGVQRGASGVRALPRPRCPTGVRSWRAAVGRAAAWLGWPGSAWSPAVSTTDSSSVCVGTWRSRLAQAVLGQRGVGFDLPVVVGGGWAVAASTAWPTGGGRMRTRIARWVGEPGCVARWRLRSVVIVCGLGPSRLVAASLPCWTATCACGRGAAAACSERRPLEAGDALTCEVGGGGEGI